MKECCIVFHSGISEDTYILCLTNLIWLCGKADRQDIQVLQRSDISCSVGFFQKKKKTAQLPIRSNSDDDLVFDDEQQPRLINVIRRDFTTKKEVSYRYQMVQDYIQLKSK